MRIAFPAAAAFPPPPLSSAAIVEFRVTNWLYDMRARDFDTIFENENFCAIHSSKLLISLFIDWMI